MTLRFHLTPIKIAIIKNSVDSTCWERCGERGPFFHCWWDCKLEQLDWKSVWVPQKLEIDLLDNPAIPFMGIYPKDAPPYHNDMSSTMFIVALFVIARS